MITHPKSSQNNRNENGRILGLPADPSLTSAAHPLLWVVAQLQQAAPTCFVQGPLPEAGGWLQEEASTVGTCAWQLCHWVCPHWTTG